MTNLNTNLFPAILDACKRLPSAYLGVRLLDETQLCLLFDGGIATYGYRGDKMELSADTIVKEMEKTVADCIANGQGVLITANDEAHGRAYSVFYYDGDIVLKAGGSADISDLLGMEPALEFAKAPWSKRLETVRRSVFALPYIPRPISNTRKYLSRLELSIHKHWQSGQRNLIPDVIACGVVFADVLTVAFGCEWDYGKIGCEDIALRIGRATIYPFLRVKNFVRDSESTLTSIWDWLDTVTNDI